ncbi:MAG: hypothetical protein Q9165_007260 [Trypethelium subeluteriae]
MTGNPTLFQAFEWNVPADQHHWQRLRNILPQLKAIGFDTLWLPPACKGNNFKGNGYDIYDLYDLGEFHQKGSRNTKWGSKEDLMALGLEARALGIGLYFDAVLNHRCGGDATERVRVVQVDDRGTESGPLAQYRRRNITKPYDIEAWLSFFFPGRQGKYSAFRYHWYHFNASDYDNTTGKKAIFKVVADGKDWQQDVDKASHGNYDYLLLNNLDYSNKDLREEVKRWGQWVVQELGLSGFRLDAVKHFSQGFVNDWVNAVSTGSHKDLFFVGEHWTDDTRSLVRWLASAPPNFHLFDAPLLYNLARTSWSKDPDLRQVFRGTLVEARPNNAVTLVMNHDTHPPTCWGKLPDLVLARKLYAYGTQTDYFETKSCIGWVRGGALEGSKRSGLAVVMNWQQKPPSGTGVGAMDRIRQAFQRPNRAEPPSRDMTSPSATASQQPKPPSPRIRMRVGSEHVGQTWRDLLGWEWAGVVIDSEGFGVFPCQPNSLAVFTAADAEERDKFPVNFSHNIYDKT